MENIQQKHILEKDIHLSIAYTIAFGKPTSKKNIQNYITGSGRYTTIVDKYKECFTFEKRTDKRMGKLIKSKPEIILDLIELKTKIDKKTIIHLKQLLNNKLLLKEINKVIKSKIKSNYQPINHIIILKELAILFIGKYVITEYKKYFNPKIKPNNEFLKKYNQLDKDFLPEIYDTKRKNKHDKNSMEMRVTIEKIDHESIKKIIKLHPDYKLLIETTKAGMLIAKTYI